MNDSIIPGVFYAQIGNEMQKINCLIDISTTESTDDNLIPYDLSNLTEVELSGSFALDEKFANETELVISGILDMAIKLCPDNRVRYLALYSKKKRTRKKNIRRIFRMIERSKNYG